MRLDHTLKPGFVSPAQLRHHTVGLCKGSALLDPGAAESVPAHNAELPLGCSTLCQLLTVLRCCYSCQESPWARQWDGVRAAVVALGYSGILLCQENPQMAGRQAL